MESAYDAVVVGSGFGGGITACRLAEQGWRVCVLERGRRFGPGDFPDRPEQAPRMFLHARHNPGGFFDLRIMKDVAVMTGAGVGGGSLVYANVQLRAPDDVFDDPAWPAAIDAAALRPYYDRTEDALQPRETPRRRPPLPKIRAFDAMAARAGLASERLPIAVHFGDDRRHPFSGAFQQGCQNLGRCDIGCPRERAQHRRHHVRRARREPRRRGLPAARGAADRPARAATAALARRLPRPAVPQRRARSARRCSCSPPARSARRGCC